MSRFSTLLVLALSAVAYGDQISEEINISPRRVVGHVQANIRNFPYSASLRADDVHICSAAIISSTWAVTAARCTYNRPIETLSIAAGTGNIYSGGQVEAIAEVVVNPNYNPEASTSDISLVRVASELILSDNIRPIALPNKDYSAPIGIDGVITEWITRSGETRPELHQNWLPVMGQDSCVSFYGAELTDKALCIGWTFNNRFFCDGEFGSPYVLDGVLVGIASQILGCSKPPGLFTSVSDYRDWIASNTGL